MKTWSRSIVELRRRTVNVTIVAVLSLSFVFLALGIDRDTKTG
jgi:hypothetical protein